MNKEPNQSGGDKELNQSDGKLMNEEEPIRSDGNKEPNLKNWTVN